MTKYFIAEAVVQTTFKFEVAAENEQDAQAKAQEMARNKAQLGQVINLTLTPDGETEYEVGQTVKHFLFGRGRIAALTRTTNALDEEGYQAKIEFESGDEKDIHIPMLKGKLEIVDA